MISFIKRNIINPDSGDILWLDEPVVTFLFMLRTCIMGPKLWNVCGSKNNTFVSVPHRFDEASYSLVLVMQKQSQNNRYEVAMFSKFFNNARV